ncbi:MAG: hypothetical protein ABR564_02910 [Candidatus Dormibacteria bacterium]
MATLVVVSTAAVVLVLVLLVNRQSGMAPVHTGPLKVENDVAVKASPPKGSCGTTFTFVATGTVNGVGRMVYRWEQSDGRSTPDLSVDIGQTVGSYALHQSWRLEGAQMVQGAMTFRVLKPTPRAASAAIVYSCS